MITRHKYKAITGVVIWTLVLVVFVVLLVLFKTQHERMAGLISRKALNTIVLSGFAIQYLVFFWGASHLVKAKGYSNAMVLFGIFWPAQMVVLAILLFALPDKCSQPMPRKKHARDESPIARIIRYRRNAYVANVIGVVGVLVALAMFFLPLGLFATRENARITAVFVFVFSYMAIINGCYWWVKSKSWNDAVVVIGLMPLAVFFIPYVRLIYRAVPLLFPATMVLMPVILIGVVAVLPDKSGIPKRRH